MMLFTERLKSLKEDVLEYVRNKLDEKNSYDIRTTLYDDHLNAGYEELITYEIKIVLKKDDKYVFEVEGYDNRVFPLENLDIDSLCEVADQIHLYPLKDLKITKNE